MASFKDVLDIGLDLGTFGLEMKNWPDFIRMVRLAKGGITSFLGGKTQGNSPAGSSDTETITENEPQLGEFNALLGYLAGIVQGNGKDAKPITDYRAKPGEERIYPALLKAMKPGAAKLLARTVGVNIVKVRKRKIVGESEYEVEGRNKKKVPIVEESEEMKNLSGPEITGALTWLVLHSDGTNLDERVQNTADRIVALQLFNSKLDAAKELKTKGVEEVKKFMGWVDTHAHLLAAILTLGPKRFQDFIERPETDRALARIRSAKLTTTKRERQEAFQGELVAKAEEVNQERIRKDTAAWKTLGWGAVGLILVLAVTLLITAKCGNP